MAFEIIDFGDSIRVAGKLDTMATMVRHMKPVMEAIADDMLRVTAIVFGSDGRRGGGSWAKLKPTTVAKKGDTQILRTEYARPGYSSIGGNALFRSVTERGAPYQVLHVTNYTVEFGTDRPYAGAHQFGAPKRNIPKRQFIKFTDKDVDRWSNLISNQAMRPFIK